MNGNALNPRSKVRIFISHNKADNELGYWLADELRRILGGKENVWYDTRGGRYNSKAGIRPGDDWPKEIATNLRRSNLFLLLWSNHSKNADWVRHELSIAKKRLVEGKLRILPICIDGCRPSFDLENIQYISYSSGDDYQPVLDDVLRFLKLPPITDNIQTRSGKRVVFEIQEAYENKEWPTILEKYPMLYELYPEAISATICYIYAIALFEVGNLPQAKLAITKGMMLTNDEKSKALLRDYAKLLSQGKFWQEVLSLAKHAVENFPHDTFWYQLREQAYNERFQSSSNQDSPLFYIAQDFGSMGKVTNFPNPKESSYLHPEQVSSFSSNNIAATFPDPNSTLKLRAVDLSNSSKPRDVDTNRSVSDPKTEQYYLDTDMSLNATKKLTEGESQPDVKSGTLHRVNALTEQHIPHHRISMLWTPSWISTLILNLILLLLVFSVWSPSALEIWISVISVLLILAIGKILGRESFLSFLFALLVSVFWITVGYCFSYYLYHMSNWAPNASYTTWLEAVCSTLFWAGGFSWHLRLFRKNE
jgi:tetratricopeptide (TPR) repeat protein